MWLPVLSAIIGIIAFLPINFYPVVFVFLTPLFIFFLREKKFWRLVAGAMLFRLIFLLGTVYFTLEPILWTQGILLFLGLPVSVFLFKKFVNKADSLLPILIFLPFAWTFFDLLQAKFALTPSFTDASGNALGSSPFLGLAGIGGFVALTFFVALINVLVTSLITWRSNRQVISVLIAAIVIVVFLGWQISNFELHKNAVAYANLPNSINISVVSTNGTFTADSFGELTGELTDKKTDLVVFPEDIFNQRTSSVTFQNTAKDLETNVLAAYDTFSDENGIKHNSAILFGADGAVLGIHNKNRLTFIGEYWPFGDWQPSIYTWLREQTPDIGTYAIFDQKNADQPGERNLLSVKIQGNTVLFAAPICVEVLYPDDLKEYKADGAQFIINQSSNRWIGIGLHHYLYLMNNLRKIEAVWLEMPIISSGVYSSAGITLPNGQTHSVNYQKGDKNYNIFFGNLRY